MKLTALEASELYQLDAEPNTIVVNRVLTDIYEIIRQTAPLSKSVSFANTVYGDGRVRYQIRNPHGMFERFSYVFHDGYLDYVITRREMQQVLDTLSKDGYHIKRLEEHNTFTFDFKITWA